MQFGSQSTDFEDCPRNLDLGPDECPGLDDAGNLSDSLHDAASQLSLIVCFDLNK